MKQPYKEKIGNLIESCESRVVLIQKMIDGQKASNPQEATQYLKQIENGLQKIQELVDIS
jgi:hypothetical protein